MSSHDAPLTHLTTYLDQLRDQADLTVHCTLDGCTWTFSGTTLDARMAAEEHRRTIHRRTIHRRRKGAKRGRRK